MLLSLLTISAVASALSTECTTSTTQKPDTTETYSITIGPHERTFNVYLPPSYGVSLHPMILAFHGNSKTADEQQRLDRFTSPLYNKGHIVVYPQGYKNHWQPGPYADPTASDLDFIAALLPELNTSLCIDTDRIYAAGKSVGGGFVDVLACDPNLGPKFAAFAPVSGALYWDTPTNYTSCQPGAKLTPIIEFHGIQDCVIPYDGGEHQDDDLPNIGVWAKWWSERNGCEKAPVVTDMFGGNVKKIEYVGCNTVHYKINGLGHTWPATVPNGDSCIPTYLNATQYIMDWFEAHTLSMRGGSDGSFKVQK